MKSKKVMAFLVKFKFTETEFTNLNLINLCKIFDVKFIDISRIFKKKIIILQSKIKIKKIFYHNIITISDLKKKLLKVDYVFDFQQSINNNKIILNFFNKVKPKEFKVLCQTGGSLPNFFNHNNIQKIFFLFSFIFNVFKYRLFFKAIKNLKHYLKIFFLSLNKKKFSNYNFFYDYLLVANDVADKNADYYFNYSKKIYGHYKDYELHLLKINNEQYQNNYAVFIDEAIFNHPDNFEPLGGNRLNTKKNIYLYFRDLNNFFDNFEKYTSTKIIIAAHPRSLDFDYENQDFDYENYLNGRKVIKHKTYELIKKSKLVFAHYSTSVSHAVMLKKPLIFLNSSLMFDIGYFTKILSYSIETGCKMIDIKNNNINYNNLFNQDLSLYKNYVNKFLKSSKSRNKNLWDIVNSKIDNN